MARYAHGHKRETKARILNAAMALFRSEGIEGVGVAAVMNARGLGSRWLLRAFPVEGSLAVRRDCERRRGDGFATSCGRDRRAAGLWPRPHHRALPIPDASRSAEAGCCIPALVSEISRHPATTRQAFTRRVRDMLTLLGEFSDTSEPDVTAIRVLATLVGSLELDRAVSDPALSDKFLREGSRAASLLASDTHPKTSASAAT